MRQCNKCDSFIASPYNPDQGAGMCGHLKEKLAICAAENRRPEPKGLEKFYSILGGTYGTGKAVFWPESDRSKCRKFEPKKQG